jgi:hypothetical protein
LYKGFDLAIMVQGQWAVPSIRYLAVHWDRTGQGYVDNALGTFRNRWRSASDPGDGLISKAYSSFGRIVNTDWLYPSDYSEFENITLGYNLERF